MDVAQKINYLLAEKGMSKREFARRLSGLEPHLKRTGTVPSEQTIYGYLNGKREIKIELIPYIAEVLGVSEQELFSMDIEYASAYNVRYSQEMRELIDLLGYAPKHIRDEIRQLLLDIKKNSEEKIRQIRSHSKQ